MICHKAHHHWNASGRGQACTVITVVESVSCVRLFPTPWTVAHQAPLSMEFPRQECWSRLPFPTPGDLSHQDWTWVCYRNLEDMGWIWKPHKPAYGTSIYPFSQCNWFGKVSHGDYRIRSTILVKLGFVTGLKIEHGSGKMLYIKSEWNNKGKMKSISAEKGAGVILWSATSLEDKTAPCLNRLHVRRACLLDLLSLLRRVAVKTGRSRGNPSGLCLSLQNPAISLPTVGISFFCGLTLIQILYILSGH